MPWITPNYRDTDFKWPLCIDDKITIFLDRTYGWQLDIADQCINKIKHSGYGLLFIVLSYFEMIAKYQDGYIGTPKSKQYFKKGVYSVFPKLSQERKKDVDALLDALYSGARCGLYHSGMTNKQIILTGDIKSPMLFETQTSKLIINPHLLIPALKDHLNDYGKKLRDVKNVDLRQNFEKRFDFDASQ